MGICARVRAKVRKCKEIGEIGEGESCGIFLGGVSGKSCGQRVVESWLSEFPTQVQPENGAVLRGSFGV